MRIYCLNIAVDNIRPEEALLFVQGFLQDNRQHYLVTPNPEMVVRASSDASFRRALVQADLALPDGFGLVAVLRLLGYKFYGRITGADFLNTLLCQLPRGTTFFFLGGENGVAAAAAREAEKRYGAKIVGSAEPSRCVYEANDEIRIIDEVEHRRLIEQIRQAAPQVLIVALGHGKQEKWLAQFLPRCPSVKIGMGVGGALDYLAARIQRAPAILRSMGLEWLWRLWHQPNRWRRIIVATIIFPIKTLRWWLCMRLKYRPLVVGCIINQRGEVLLVERTDQKDHWQFPQGGREPNETAAEAVLREMKEEIGLSNLEIIGQTKENVYRYRWKKVWMDAPESPWAKRHYYGYKGQQVTVFYLKFSDHDKNINVDRKELIAWRWVPQNELLAIIHPVRRTLAKIILADLKHYTAQADDALRDH